MCREHCLVQFEPQLCSEMMEKAHPKAHSQHSSSSYYAKKKRFLAKVSIRFAGTSVDTISTEHLQD